MPRLKLPDGTSWPDPEHLCDLEHRLRYSDAHATVSASDRLCAADAICTLLHLYQVPSAAKHLPMIRRALLASAGRGA